MSHHRFWAGALILAAVAGAAVWFSLPAYGKIGPHAYELATALYSACNQQDSERVEAVAELIERAIEAKELNPKEVQWLTEIVDEARAGHWQPAFHHTRQLMEAQVER